MRSGPDQRSRGRYKGNRPTQQQPRGLQNHVTFDSNGSGVRIRGNPSQIHERYLALAREALTNEDRVAAENFYQHAEHYFRLNGTDREGNPAGASPPAARVGVEATEPSETERDDGQP